MYRIYLGGLLLPVAPGEISTKIKNANKTLTLVNEGEISFLRAAGLTELEFTVLLPATPYSFALYDGGYKAPAAYLSHFERLKTGREPFQFIVVRELTGGGSIHNTNLTVSLEDYTVREKSTEGSDLLVDLRLKQYRPYGTSRVQVIKQKTRVKKARRAENSPAPAQNGSYTVRDGDCLWNIAKALYDDGSRYTELYEANRDKIQNPNLIYTGQVLTIPKA